MCVYWGSPATRGPGHWPGLAGDQDCVFVALCVDARLAPPPECVPTHRHVGRGAMRRLFGFQCRGESAEKPPLLETGAKNGQNLLSHRTAGETREIGKHLCRNTRGGFP